MSDLTIALIAGALSGVVSGAVAGVFAARNVLRQRATYRDIRQTSGRDSTVGPTGGVVQSERQGGAS